jgi:hypothetical protein
MKLYSSYLFRDKDPIIYQVWDIIKHVPFSEIEHKSGVSVQTLHKWFYGKTCRPQAATVRAVLRAAGYDWRIVKNMQDVPKRPADMQQPVREHASGLRVIDGKKKRRHPNWKALASQRIKRERKRAEEQGGGEAA